MKNSNLEKTLLKRYNLIFISNEIIINQTSKKLVNAIKEQLLDLGYVITFKLEEALSKLSLTEIEVYNKLLFETLSENIGTNFTHTPLYRKFPEGVPENTHHLWIKRLASLTLQNTITETSPDKVHILSCGHIVHEDFWDRKNYSACPICERKVDLSSHFFLNPDARKPLTEKTDLKLIDLGQDLKIYVKNIFTSLLNRKTSLSPSDLELLNLIIEEYSNEIDTWEISTIPLKETLAIVSAKINTFDFLKKHLKTSTDILRYVVALNSGDVSLLEPPKFKSLPRSKRRNILSIMNDFNIDNLTEDILRHDLDWKRLGEILHPFEYAKKFPKVATAFIVLRETISNKKLSTIVNEVQKTKSFVLKGKKLKFKNYASKFNDFIANKQFDELFTLLSQKPGELGRRLDLVLRTINHSDYSKILNIFKISVENISTPILSTLTGYLTYRTNKSTTDRVYFPKGNISKVRCSVDTREPLHIDALNFVEVIKSELLKRSSKLKTYNYSIVDSKLKNIIVPFNERSLSKSLISIPRGSKIKVEEGKTIRMFIHWMESEESGRVDLDSSFLFYDENWKYIGQCAFNDRNFGNSAALHSGDLTSAPAPLGASEFVDLYIDKLKSVKVKYVVSEVYSFNSIPFEKLGSAYAGYMVRDKVNEGEIFEPSTVKQKFDLQGESTVIMPFILDIENFELTWTDIHLTERVNSYQSVESHKATLDKMCKSLIDYFNSGVRPDMYELSIIHASTRSNRVFIKNDDIYYSVYMKGFLSNDNFYKKINSQIPDYKTNILPNDECLALLYRDFNITDNSEVFSIYRENSNGTHKNLSSSDLLSI